MSEAQSDIIHRQLGELEDLQGRTLQDRFEDFCQDAVAHLTAKRKDGEPVIPAGKGKSKLKIEISVERLADDSLVFEFAHVLGVKHPQIPAKRCTSPMVQGVGLAARKGHEESPLFDPANGQPEAMTEDEARLRISAG